LTVAQTQNPFRALPVLIALVFNLFIGPALPLIASAATNIPDYSQCQIGNPKPVALDCDGWINGILNATHNDYAEDEVVPQRLIVDFDTTGAHSVQLSYMTRKDSGTQHHAYDYLATWNYTYVNADKCQDLNPASLCIPNSDPTASFLNIPSDGNSVSPGGPQPTSAHELPQANRQFVMYGGDLTGTSAITHTTDPAEAGSDYGVITINFNVTDADGRVMLLFGGHLAAGLGDRGWGAGLGAADISGGPYHIRLTAVDSDSIGNRDNQIMSNAITPLFPSLVIEKVADAATVSAGTNIGFTITVTNNGPGVANNVTLNDPLPAGSGVDWDIVPAYAGPGTCSITGSPPTETLECAFGNMADDASASVHVQSATTADSCGDYPNTATADADNFDPIEASASTTVLCADIEVEKTPDLPGDPGGTVNAGGIATFTFVVTNNGLGNATGVTLEDTLPTVDAGWALGVDFDEEFCTLVVNDLDCAFGTLASGAFRTVQVWTPVTTFDCGTLVNLDAFADTTNDGDDTDDGAILVTCPDLQISKSADDPEVNAGDSASYTITVSNGLGEGTAEDVVISDTLPSGLTWTDDSDDCTITGGNLLSCGPLDVPAGGSFSVTVTGTTDADDCPSILNRATFTSTNAGDGESHPQGEGAQITINCPDLLVEKTGSGTVNATDGIFFEITVTNLGPGDAYDFAFNDTLPDVAGGWTLDSFDAPASCSLIGLALSCSVPPDDIFLALDSFTVTVVADTEFEDCGKLENLASASASNEAEEDLENNSDTHDIVVECPDLTAEKDADDPETVSAGEDIGFTVTVSNSSDPGTGTAYDVVIDDPLPAGSGLDWEIDPAYAGPGTCEIQGSPGAETLYCELGDLDPGEGATVHVVSGTAPADCATYENVAEVSADNHPTLEPSDSTTVQCPGLNVAKVADPDTIDAGELAVFDIVVWNTGPGTAFDVTLHDELPGDIIWIELSDDCDIVAGVLDCSFGDLGVTTQENSPARVTVFGLTDREDCGELDNTAIADANPGEPIQASASITVKCPEVSIVKSNDQPAPVLPGTVVSYTLHVTVSDGPADDVVVVDTLPLGLDDPTSISDGGVWDGTDRTITWDLGDDVANGVHTLTYQAAVSLGAEHGDELTNVAIVTSSNSQCPDDETLAPECEDDSTVTVRVPTLVIDKAANVELITKTLDSEGNVIDIDPEVVTWTLTYTLTNGPVTNAVITDPIPAGLTYVDLSASDGGVYDIPTNTLTWTFPELTDSGFVTFQTTVNEDAPVGVILNVATIESNETEPDEGEDSIRIVEDQELGGTSTPLPSLPSTALNQPSSGGSLAALLFGFILIAALGGLAYVNVIAVRRRR
jgi:uncharacterized repeat protein (TIGR01451 family)/fimbrial isopeptide formation D2 family protein